MRKIFFLPATIEIERHLFWSNLKIKNRFISNKIEQKINTTNPTDTLFGFNISKYKIEHRKDQILRNLVNPEVGLYLFEIAKGLTTRIRTSQISFFNE